MGSEETVKVHIAINIQSESSYDTGMSVEAWNALTEEERSNIKMGFWDEEASNDNGGVWVETEGAL